MADQTIASTEEMVGSGHATKADTLNRLTLVEHHTDGGHECDNVTPHFYAADAEVSDTYAITLSPAATAYNTGMLVAFKANTINTGACTLNVNSLGAKAIKRDANVDPANGDIAAGQIILLGYDGTNFQMLTRSQAIPSGTKMIFK